MGFRLVNVDGRAALVAGDQYHDLEAVAAGRLGPDPMGALADLDLLHALAEDLDGRSPTGAVADARLGPPVPRPRNCYGIGLNYRDHAAESDMQVGEHPVVFAKFPSCLAGPHDDVELSGDQCDYEGELVVVVGPGGRDIARDEAWSHVAGLTVGQDVSDRARQFAANPPHFDLGKSFDTFGPIGPALVSPDLLDDPSDLVLTTEINGEERQRDTTANMIHDVPAVIAYLSRVTTLTSGDLIFTGTPAGVGATTRSFLVDGDLITTRIDGVGTMSNRCRRRDA